MKPSFVYCAVFLALHVSLSSYLTIHFSGYKKNATSTTSLSSIPRQHVRTCGYPSRMETTEERSSSANETRLNDSDSYTYSGSEKSETGFEYRVSNEMQPPPTSSFLTERSRIEVRQSRTSIWQCR